MSSEHSPLGRVGNAFDPRNPEEELTRILERDRISDDQLEKLSQDCDAKEFLKLSQDCGPNEFLKFSQDCDPNELLKLSHDYDPNELLKLSQHYDPNELLKLSQDFDPKQLDDLAPAQDQDFASLFESLGAEATSQNFALAVPDGERWRWLGRGDRVETFGTVGAAQSDRSSIAAGNFARIARVISVCRDEPVFLEWLDEG